MHGLLWLSDTGQTHRRRVQTPDDAVNATGRTQKPKKGFTRVRVHEPGLLRGEGGPAGMSL